ncbi:hypothetical protein EAO13_30290 [Klebsiella pneumoniae]|nr:hypothetical protein EAO13_30290 [Klebsiella pneumoniae]
MDLSYENATCAIYRTASTNLLVLTSNQYGGPPSAWVLSSVLSVTVEAILVLTIQWIEWLDFLP